MARARKPDIPKVCIHCGVPIVRKRYPCGQLETYSRYLSRQACSQSCANRRHEVGLSALRWRARQLREDECERCGATENLHAHHRDGDVTNNTPENISTLCATCHIGGHWAEKRGGMIFGG